MLRWAIRLDEVPACRLYFDLDLEEKLEKQVHFRECRYMEISAGGGGSPPPLSGARAAAGDFGSSLCPSSFWRSSIIFLMQTYFMTFMEVHVFYAVNLLGQGSEARRLQALLLHSSPNMDEVTQVKSKALQIRCKLYISMVK